MATWPQAFEIISNLNEAARTAAPDEAPLASSFEREKITDKTSLDEARIERAAHPDMLLH
jgi:hypothetical protein